MDKTTREIKENNNNNEWRYQRPISSGSIERYPDVAVDLWNMGAVMPVRNALKDSGPVPVNGAVHGADGIHNGCTKGFARGYGRVFSVSGIIWQDEGIRGSAGGDALLLYRQ